MTVSPITVDPDHMLDMKPLDLDRVRVGDCMHHGIIACDPTAPLAEVASIMATNRVHAVAVHHGVYRPHGIISDLDVIAAAAAGTAPTAADIAATEVLSVSTDCSLREAARLMAEHGVTHVIAIERSNGHAVGILSTTDIVAAYARAAGVDVTP
jgi:CBS domain-containing protein